MRPSCWLWEWPSLSWSVRLLQFYRWRRLFLCYWVGWVGFVLFEASLASYRHCRGGGWPWFNVSIMLIKWSTNDVVDCLKGWEIGYAYSHLSVIFPVLFSLFCCLFFAFASQFMSHMLLSFNKIDYHSKEEKEKKKTHLVKRPLNSTSLEWLQARIKDGDCVKQVDRQHKTFPTTTTWKLTHYRWDKALTIGRRGYGRKE